ncbi:MAG: hypothetical protein ACYCWW_21300, partial [Deltaproteobacteria bacterium]
RAPPAPEPAEPVRPPAEAPAARSLPAEAVSQPPSGEVVSVDGAPSHPGRAVSIGMIVVGALAVGAGGYFGVQAEGAIGSAQAAGVDQLQAASFKSNAVQQATTANVLFIAGAIVAVAGGALWGVW